MIKIPAKCNFIFDLLNSSGFTCYAVGGCVRDSLMGREPIDWDFTTDALPCEIEEVFSQYKTLEIGKKFGTITVINGDNSFEITTFRADGEYSDSRHPDSVSFTKSIFNDLSRRDFTMNSIAYSPWSGLVDPFDGYNDIKSKIIRCTGNPFKRFNEDAIRIFRAIRFASALSFKIEAETEKAVFSTCTLLSKVHPSRLRKELEGLMKGDNIVSVLKTYRDVISVVIPEIRPMFDTEQNNPHHVYNVWDHTLKALEYTEGDLLKRFTVFFHDIGKPFCKTTDNKGIDHFKKHQQKSAEITESVVKRFSFPSVFTSDLLLLVKHHDERFRNLKYDVKRLLGILGESLFFVLTDILRSDFMAQSDFRRDEKISHRDLVIHTANEIIKNRECCSLSSLEVNGHDLIKLGFIGEDIGIVLNNLLNMVMRDKIINKKEDLIVYAESLRNNKLSD